MLHKLALAANKNNPTLLKEALPTPAEDLLIKQRIDQKAMDLAHARGIDVPLVPKAQFDPGTGNVIKGLEPSTEKLRMSKKGQPTSALVEKEIQKAHGQVSNSKLKQLRHNTVGKAKRVWGGKGLLGGKWRNRAAILGGVGALGLGLKSYFDSDDTPQPQQAPPEPEYPAYGGYPKMGSSKYSPDAVTIPKPTAQPKVSPLGPGVGSTPTISASGMGSTTSPGLGGSSKGSGGSMSGGGSKEAGDEGVGALLGVGAGGLGGWALGEKVLAPILKNKERNIAEEIARKQQTLQGYQKLRKAAPIGAAAAGALLLAALTAMYTRKKTQQEVRPVQINPYDQTQAGFNPHEQNQWGNFYG